MKINKFFLVRGTEEEKLSKYVYLWEQLPSLPIQMEGNYGWLQRYCYSGFEKYIDFEIKPGEVRAILFYIKEDDED